MLTREEAAADLGITANAVRQRIKRGTLPGIKTNAGWLVDMAATNDRPTTPNDPKPTIALAPLADGIRDQNRRLEELSASAAFWQVRALRVEEQWQALTPVSRDRAGDRP